MFYSYTQRKRLCFYQYFFVQKQLKDITRGMTGGQYHSICFKQIAIGCLHLLNYIVFYNKIDYFLFKQYSTAAIRNLFSHGSNNLRQFIGTNMRMRFVENIFCCAELKK